MLESILAFWTKRPSPIDRLNFAAPPPALVSLHLPWTLLRAMKLHTTIRPPPLAHNTRSFHPLQCNTRTFTIRQPRATLHLHNCNLQQALGRLRLIVILTQQHGIRLVTSHLLIPFTVPDNRLVVLNGWMVCLPKTPVTRPVADLPSSRSQFTTIFDDLRRVDITHDLSSIYICTSTSDTERNFISCEM